MHHKSGTIEEQKLTYRLGSSLIKSSGSFAHLQKVSIHALPVFSAQSKADKTLPALHAALTLPLGLVGLVPGTQRFVLAESIITANASFLLD
jgi:hypothetical protein